MLRSIIFICFGYNLATAAAVSAPEIDYHGFNLDAYSALLKSQPVPLYTQPILKGYPQPSYPSPLIKQTFLPAPVYEPAPIFKALAPIYAAPVLKEAAPVYAPAPVYASAPVYAPAEVYKAAVPVLKAVAPVVKAVAPVVKAVAPATSYASVTKYHISHAPVLKAVVPVAPVVKEISYDHSYGYH